MNERYSSVQFQDVEALSVTRQSHVCMPAVSTAVGHVRLDIPETGCFVQVLGI